MERFEKLVAKEIKEQLAEDLEKQARATALTKKIFQWHSEGGISRIEEGLKQEVSAIEHGFERQEKKILDSLEER